MICFPLASRARNIYLRDVYKPLLYVVFRINDKSVAGWKADSSVAHCEPCF